MTGVWIGRPRRPYFASVNKLISSVMIETEFLNRVEIRGRVGHDAKIFTVGETRMARFSVATNEAFRGRNGELREEVTWHNVAVWAGKNVMDLANLQKGAFVYLTGRLRNTKYTSGDGTEKHIIQMRTFPFRL